LENKELNLLNPKKQKEERLKAYELAYQIVVDLSSKNVSYSTAKLALLTAIEEIGELKLIKID